MKQTVVFRYVGDGSFIPLVPRRDLTAADVERLKQLFENLETLLTESGLYVRAETKLQSPQPENKSRGG